MSAELQIPRDLRDRPPQRIASLVPSLTEALFSLGLGERVVAVTEFCVHPAEGVASVPKVGGTKDPDVEAIVALRPDFVVANREENTRRSIEALRHAGLRVWVTEPRTVADGVALLSELANLGASEASREAMVEPLERALEVRRQLSRQAERKPTVFCAVWRDPWMTVRCDTYMHDMIEVCGGANPFASQGLGDPKGRRYPVVTLDQVVEAQPHVILLPDEPYAFGPGDVEELEALDVPAAASRRIHCLDGTLLSWYGPRIKGALSVLPPLIEACEAD